MDEAVRDNYRSAQDHMDQVKEQIRKDLDKGDIVEMTLLWCRSELRNL
jgi:hypothetical protein